MRGLGATGLWLLLFPILCMRWYKNRDTQKKAWLSVLLVGSGIVGWAMIILMAAPSGAPVPDSPVQQRFTSDAQFGRLALANIIPEVDQVNLGFFLMSYVDPFLDTEKVDRISPLTLALYHDMEKDPNFRELGSVMGLAYADLFGLPTDAGHYYLYVPQNTGEEPLPAFVFLHGSVGNFKTYTWVLSKLAEETGFVIIAPSYGFGNWDEAGVASVLWAIEDAQEMVALDEEQIFLAGLSNGGLGVSLLAESYPQMFQGLVFFSPVMDTGIVDSPSFQAEWVDRPVLVITGAEDRRIPLGYIEDRITRMTAGGIDVSRIIFPDEDHFLFFSQPDRIMDDVADWLTEKR